MRTPARLPRPLGSPILTGHYRMGAGYSCFRSTGTGDWLLIATVSGLGRFGTPRGDLIAEPGDVFLLRPGSFHDYGVEATRRQWELLWAHVQPRPDWLDLLDWPEVAPGLMRLRLDAGQRTEVFARLAEVHRRAAGVGRRREQAAMCAFEDLLLHLDLFNPRSAQAGLDPRIRVALDFLCANLERKLVLANVARECGLSASRLAHLFRAQVGTTPQRFLEERRLERARHLLAHSALPVQDVAVAAGFSSPFYFAVRFRRATGHSPRAWRRKQGG